MEGTPQPTGDTEQQTTESGTIDVSILGGRKFKGRWRPPKKMTLVSVIGGREIDLREAEIPSEGITINVVGLVGGTHVIVPDGINVEAPRLVSSLAAAPRHTEPRPAFGVRSASI